MVLLPVVAHLHGLGGQHLGWTAELQDMIWVLRTAKCSTNMLGVTHFGVV